MLCRAFSSNITSWSMHSRSTCFACRYTAKTPLGTPGHHKCRERAKQSVWWLGISKQIEEMIQKCLVGCPYHIQHAEPLLPTMFPDYPWQKVGADLFTFKGSDYLLMIDYYSCYVEMSKLYSTTSLTIIQHEIHLRSAWHTRNFNFR